MMGANIKKIWEMLMGSAFPMVSGEKIWYTYLERI